MDNWILLGFNVAILVGSAIAVFNIRRRKQSIPWRTGLLVMVSLTLFSLASVVGTANLINTGSPSEGPVKVAIWSLRALASAPIIGFVLRYALPLRITGGLERWLLPM